ncbi:MAG: OmpA family protein [Saprospiraceae bacterium]|nr:OmpA family protein [Saprospiraceae bacterium]
MKYTKQYFLILFFTLQYLSSGFSQQNIVVKNMWNINSEGLDFAAVPYKDGLMFTSTRRNDSRATRWFDRRINDFFMDLYYVDKTSSKKARKVFGSVNKKYHDGTSVFYNKGNKMLFSRNNMKGKNSQKEIDIKIYSADKNGDEWTNVEELPFNGDDFKTCHPTISNDGQLMIFSSNRGGGSGKMDLYMVKKNGESWSQPVNIGSGINSAGNETFPFIDENGDLYFSSDRSGGFGGMDLYIAQAKEDQTWGEPKLLPRPFNSMSDDFGFYKNFETKSGYFSSDRPGGKGGDDIYYWETDIIEPETKKAETINQEIFVYDAVSKQRIAFARTAIKGYENFQLTDDDEFTTSNEGNVNATLNPKRKYEVTIKKSGYIPATIELAKDKINGKPYGIPLTPNRLMFTGTVVEKSSRNPLPNTKFVLVNLTTGDEKDITTDANGKFNIDINCDAAYEIRTIVGRTITNKVSIAPTTDDCLSGNPIERTIIAEDTRIVTPIPPPIAEPTPTKSINNNNDIKVGDKFRLDKLYYDYNKSNIRSDAALELNKVVDLMNKYPTMVISLGSHTDARGNDDYNLKLSEKRAESAYQYLIQKGINPSRISYSGYGETQLLNGCSNNTNCSEANHQLNRRTEITITSM